MVQFNSLGPNQSNWVGSFEHWKALGVVTEARKHPLFNRKIKRDFLFNLNIWLSFIFHTCNTWRWIQFSQCLSVITNCLTSYEPLHLILQINNLSVLSNFQGSVSIWNISAHLIDLSEEESKNTDNVITY